MPKQKKQPKNAYYFFMVSRKTELERQGYRFPGGMKDVANEVYNEWQGLDGSEKFKFEELARKAKEEDKTNLHNKFTVTGESYAQVMERETQLQEELRSLDELIECLTRDTELLDTRTFVVMKTINTCEVSGQFPAFYPVELAMASFNLAEGMKKNYSTLIDTEKTPIGYASTAKETLAETGLPPPGSSKFKPEHKDYTRILGKIRSFIEFYVQPYKGMYAIFVMTEDFKAVQGSLDWLVDKACTAPGEENLRNENRAFFGKVKICKLTVLLLKLARAAKARDESYNHVMALYNHLEDAAARVLNEGCFNYRDDITCSFHNQEAESSKMDICCRNVVLRRIYLIIKEIVPHMVIEMKEGHDISHFGKRGRQPPYNTGQPQVLSEPEPKEEEESSSLASIWAGTSHRKKEPKDEARASSPEEYSLAVSHLTTGTKRMAEDDGAFGWGVPIAPTKFLKTTTSSSDDADSQTLPWGRKPEPQAANLRISDDIDFPTLGNSGRQPTSAMNCGWGSRSNAPSSAPAGRGAGSLPRKPSYDDEFPGATTSSWGMSRGGVVRR